MPGNPWIVKKTAGFGLDSMEIGYSLESQWQSEILRIPVELYDTVVLPAGGSLPNIQFYQHETQLNGAHITNNIEKGKIPQFRGYLFDSMALQIWFKTAVLDFASLQTILAQLWETCYFRFTMDKSAMFDLPLSRLLTMLPTYRGDPAINTQWVYIFPMRLYLRPNMLFAFNIESYGGAIQDNTGKQQDIYFRLCLKGYEHRPLSST